MRIKDLNILYAGGSDYRENEFVREGANVIRTSVGAKRFGDYCKIADVIVLMEGVLNCYPIHVPVFDLVGGAINVEGRDVRNIEGLESFWKELEWN